MSLNVSLSFFSKASNTRLRRAVMTSSSAASTSSPAAILACLPPNSPRSAAALRFNSIRSEVINSTVWDCVEVRSISCMFATPISFRLATVFRPRCRINSRYSSLICGFKTIFLVTFPSILNPLPISFSDEKATKLSFADLSSSNVNLSGPPPSWFEFKVMFSCFVGGRPLPVDFKVMFNDPKISSLSAVAHLSATNWGTLTNHKD
mmetsp:Transcript_47312/g.82630  ORF Transcript_47312/g.82630 Transcript_47312/m.82630 type:complete len:206 (-) Transcript_47312:135-752(-)